MVQNKEPWQAGREGQAVETMGLWNHQEKTLKRKDENQT